MTQRLHGVGSALAPYQAEAMRLQQAGDILDTLVGCSAISAVRVGGKWAVRVDGGPEHFGTDLADALGQATQVILLNRESGE
jgi:hypothetical protein